MAGVSYVFELVIDFGRDEEAAVAASTRCAGWPPFLLRDVELELQGPYLTGLGSAGTGFIELSVWFGGIQFGGIRHPDLDPYTVTSAELVAVRTGLNELLAGMHGYRIAMVGWDPEELVDERELRSRIAEFGTDHLEGLVVAPPLDQELGIGHLVEPFTDGFVRIPVDPEPAAWWRRTG